MDDPNISFTVNDFNEAFGDLFNNTYDLTNLEVNENTLSCPVTPIDPVVNIAMCAFYAFIFLLALPGNLVVGFVIGSSKQALSPSDIYLLHLAVADTLLALTLPFSAVSLIRGWVFGDAMCKVVSLAQEVNFYSSILFLVCISVDRYLVIVRAMKARKENWKLWSWVMCATVWVVGFVLALPILYNEAFFPNGSEQMVCSEQYDPESAVMWRLVTRLVRHSLGFLLPLAVMLACYGVTVARLLRTRGFKKQRAMRVIVAVVAAFLVCWMPFHLSVMTDTLMRAKLVRYKCEARKSVDRALFATQSLGLLHCCINPVLYAFIGQKFRLNMLHLFCKKKALERGSASRISRSTSQTSEAYSPVM